MVPRAIELVAVSSLALLSLQNRESPHCGGGNPISPTVVSTYCGHRQDGNEMLDLLVLWRGNPGWFNRASGHGTGSGGDGESVYQYAQFGDLSIGIDINLNARTVKIHDDIVSLESSNVVLVDGVDERDHGHVVGTRWIEPTYPVNDDPLLQTFRRQAELAGYLRCDLPTPDPPQTALMRRRQTAPGICDALRAR